MSTTTGVAKLLASPVVTRPRADWNPRLGVPVRSAGGAGVHVVQLVLVDRLGDLARIDLARVGQGLQGPGDDRVGVDEEVPSHGGAGVGEAESVRAEGVVLPGDPLADEVWDHVVVVRGGDERTPRAEERRVGRECRAAW